ncbi:hypothetical protein [Streptomyces sp. NPDC017086]|uniref:hypothetical protein n=1 Tax=Streptomyces sp. NPDC017086 TaxID=3364976 RepID=UPI0037A07EB9
MNTRLVNTAADVIARAMQRGRTLPAALAVALESAQLLQSPETAAELDRLRARIAELEAAKGRAEGDARRVRWELALVRERVSEPFGCTYCGVAQRGHGRRYISGAGMHSWERPTDEQVKGRMLARRAARAPRPGKLELDQAHEELIGAALSLYEEELETARLRLALKSAQRGRRQLRDRIAALEKERAKYVGKEPTIAEEMAYLSRCIDSVLDLCEKAEKQAGGQPVPEWVEQVRAAAEGMVERRSYPPALPWARLMDDEDLAEFLDELAASAITHAAAEVALTEVEATCGRWRAIAEAQHAHSTAPGPRAERSADRLTRMLAPTQALREGEPAVPYVSRPLPPRDAVCARPGCGHTGADHHHEGAKCWGAGPRTRQRNGAWSAVPVCRCSGFVTTSHTAEASR